MSYNATSIPHRALPIGPYAYPFLRPHMGPFAWFVGLIVVFFIVLVFVGISMLIFRAIFRPWRQRRFPDDALEALRMRYARGEITSEQYCEMIKALEGR
jgi:putative membrane protein